MPYDFQGAVTAGANPNDVMKYMSDQMGGYDYDSAIKAGAKQDDVMKYMSDQMDTSGGGSTFSSRLTDRWDEFTNVSKETEDAYNAKKASETGAWSPRTETTQTTPEPKDDLFYPLKSSMVNTGKFAANVIPSAWNFGSGLASMASQQWNNLIYPAFTDLLGAVQGKHGENLVHTFFTDPAGFVQGVFGDAITKPISGVASAISDVSKGEGAGKATEDVMTGLSKGMSALIDDPVTSLIQLKYGKDFATHPIETAKGVVKPVTETAKAVAHPIETAKAIRNTVSARAESFTSGLSSIKEAWTAAGKENYEKVKNGYTNTVIDIYQNKLKSDTLQKDLQSMDKASGEFNRASEELEKSKATMEVLQNKITEVADQTAKMFHEKFKQSSETAKNLVASIASPYEQLEKMGSAIYQESLTGKDGTPIEIPASKVAETLKPFTQFVDNIDTKNLGRQFKGVQSDYQTSAWVEEMKKRFGTTDLKEMGDKIAKELNKGGHTTEEKGKLVQMLDDVTKHESRGDIKDMHTKPMTAERIKSMIQNLRNSIPEKSSGHIFEKFDEMVRNQMTSLLHDTLSAIDPERSKAVKAADKIWEKFKESGLYKAVKKANENIDVQDESLVKIIENNKTEFSQLPKEIQSALQNFVAKHVLDKARDNNGTFDMEKINKGITQYAEILGPEIANELRDVRDFYDPQTRAFSQQFNSDIQGKIDELSQKKEGLSEAETKAKTEEEKMSAAKEQAKRVGTTPQEILDGIMGIETPEQLKQFSEDTGKAPEEMGMMVVQEVARRLNTAFTENMEKTDFEGMGQIAKELTGVIKKMDPETAKQMFGDKVRADIKEVDTAVDRIRILNKEGGGKSVMVRAAKALFGVYASFFWHMHFIGMQQFAEALTGKNTRFMDLGKGEVQEKIGRLSKKNIKQPKPKKKKYRSIVKIAGVVSAGAKEAQNED